MAEETHHWAAASASTSPQDCVVALLLLHALNAMCWPSQRAPSLPCRHSLGAFCARRRERSHLCPARRMHRANAAARPPLWTAAARRGVMRTERSWEKLFSWGHSLAVCPEPSLMGKSHQCHITFSPTSHQVLFGLVLPPGLPQPSLGGGVVCPSLGRQNHTPLGSGLRTRPRRVWRCYRAL